MQRSDAYIQLQKEVKERQKDSKYTQGQVLMLEQQIKKDLLQAVKECPKCGRTEGLTLDHIVPRHMLKDYGIDVDHEIIEDNYGVLCKICNMFKSGRLDFSIPRTKEILIRLLERI